MGWNSGVLVLKNLFAFWTTCIVMPQALCYQLFTPLLQYFRVLLTIQARPITQGGNAGINMKTNRSLITFWHFVGKVEVWFKVKLWEKKQIVCSLNYRLFSIPNEGNFLWAVRKWSVACSPQYPPNHTAAFFITWKAWQLEHGPICLHIITQSITLA